MHKDMKKKNVGMNKQIVESCCGEITEQVAGKLAELTLGSGCMSRQLTCDVKRSDFQCMNCGE